MIPPGAVYVGGVRIGQIASVTLFPNPVRSLESCPPLAGDFQVEGTLSCTFAFHTPCFAPTVRQKALLLFVQCYQLTHGGRSPSYREIAAGIGQRSTQGVHRLVEGCAERGLLRRAPHRERSIELLVKLPVCHSRDGAPLYFVPVDTLPHNTVNTGVCCGASSGNPVKISSEDSL